MGTFRGQLSTLPSEKEEFFMVEAKDVRQQELARLLLQKAQ
jgi:hypothetical protein